MLTVRTGGMSKCLSIAFCYFHPPCRMPSYVARDVAILEEMAEVRWVPSQAGPTWRRHLGPGGWLPNSSMRHAIDGSDLVVQWFATPSAPVVAARLARKPVLVIAGGFDVAFVPSINYGQMVHPATRAMGRLTLRAASRVLAVSQFNASEVRRWAPRARVEVVAHGFDSSQEPRTDRSPRVLSVSEISWDYVHRKGLQDLAAATRHLPEIEFVVAGRHAHPDAVDHLRTIAGPNLRMPGFLPTHALEDLMRTSAIYLQLSRHEAFGCAMAEAMLAGCTPVITREGALPEVASDVGHYVESRDPRAVSLTIRRAMGDLRVVAAHERIRTAYPLELRRRELQRVVRELKYGLSTGTSG
jgi:glycosyltransferase involved in cell wall biosynthesis